MKSGPDRTQLFFIKDCLYTLITSLIIIFNLAIKESWKDQWKEPKVLQCWNLVPHKIPAISILSNFSKLSKSKKVRNESSLNQHGFMSQRSTVTKKFSHYVCEVLDAGDQDDVYTDFCFSV